MRSVAWVTGAAEGGAGGQRPWGAHTQTSAPGLRLSAQGSFLSFLLLQ